jgi:hypothetical protein
MDYNIKTIAKYFDDWIRDEMKKPKITVDQNDMLIFCKSDSPMFSRLAFLAGYIKGKEEAL